MKVAAELKLTPSVSVIRALVSRPRLRPPSSLAPLVRMPIRFSAVSSTVRTLATSLAVAALAATVTTSAAQESGAIKAPFQRHFIGSSLFMVANVTPNPPSFFQLNYGYRLSRKSALSVEAITWRYSAPLGIPWGPSFGKAEEEYPGRVRGVGVGIAYQRLLWRGLYAQAHALPLLQRYTDTNGARLQDGFQLFTTFRSGYQLKLFSDRWFLEPSVAATAWPINTGVPAAFAALDRKWNRYFLFEPGLHFGRRF